MTAGTANNARRPVVCLLGVNPQTPNFGVRVLLSGAVECLLHQHRDLEIRVLDYARDPAAWIEATSSGMTTLRLVNLRFSWRLYLRNNIFRLLVLVALARLVPFPGLRCRLLARNPWLKAVLESEACLSLAGGDSFSDIYGLRRMLYTALPQILVLWLGKPLILLPQTYGPFKRRLSRWLARHILRRARCVCSRDTEGVSTVRRLTGPSYLPVEVLPDLGFTMTPEPLDPAILSSLRALQHPRPLLGLNISKLLYMGGYTGRNMFGLREDYPRLTHALITFAINDLHASVLLIPHVGGELANEENETTLCRQLQAEFERTDPGRVLFVDRDFTHRQIKSLIGACDLFVGSRMHACIGAASQCVPTVALAYSDKFAGVMEVVGAAVRVVDLRVADGAEVCAAVRDAMTHRAARQAALGQRLPSLVNSIRSLLASGLVGALRGPARA